MYSCPVSFDEGSTDHCGVHAHTRTHMYMHIDRFINGGLSLVNAVQRNVLDDSKGDFSSDL